jgi:hypothetical protein
MERNFATSSDHLQPKRGRPSDYSAEIRYDQGQPQHRSEIQRYLYHAVSLPSWLTEAPE